MSTRKGSQKPAASRVAFVLSLIALAACVTACSQTMMMVRGTGARRPAPAEFGLGPRISAEGRYVATLEPSRALRPRQMQAVRVVLRDRAGQTIDEAQITIDGGMPQHGHGLPTRPRVTTSFGQGAYQIDGVRFSMGGWWEFKLVIVGPLGTDTITFNLDI